MLRCELQGGDGKPALKVLDAVYLEGMHLLEELCEGPDLGGFFGAVEIHTAHRDTLDLRELYDNAYDLVLAKPELIDRVTQVGQSYTLVAQYPDYGSRLVSLHGIPELTRRWLQGKRLGMLDDPFSVSGYQIPKLALQRLDLGGVPAITYYPTYTQLYQALASGEVDLIASPTLFEDDDDTLPPGLMLAERIAGPGWYLRSALLDSGSHCQLDRRLAAISRDSTLGYLHHLHIVRLCREPG